MSNNNTVYNDMLDIIFENRNKKYGAYDLRKNYSRDLGAALVLGLLLIGGSYLLGLNIDKFSLEAEDDKMEDMEIEMGPPPDIDPNTPPPPPPPKIETPPPPTRSTVKYVPPVIKKDEEVVEEEPTKDLEELKEVEEDIGVEDKEGTDDAPPEIIDNPIDTIVEEVKAAPVVKDEILDFVEKSASFPGGEAELLGFLQKNISYPNIARENNIQGRVILRFVVEKDGSITNAEVVRKLGGGCDEEALRVVKSMPKWIPANQNGRAVRQRYTLPVLFKLAG